MADFKNHIMCQPLI